MLIQLSLTTKDDCLRSSRRARIASLSKRKLRFYNLWSAKMLRCKKAKIKLMSAKVKWLSAVLQETSLSVSATTPKTV